MGLALATAGVFGIITPLYSKLVTLYNSISFTPLPPTHNTPFPPTVGAAYEEVHKRTFLAMSIMILAQLPILLFLVLLYRKLGQLRKQNMRIDATEPLPSSTHGSSSDLDNTKNKKDATEASELLTQERKCLEEST